MTEIYRYGFEYKGLLFGWKNKELYRLPSFKNFRSYGLRRLPVINIGNKKGYRVCRDPKTIDQLKQITEVINYTHTVNGQGSDDTPF